MTGASSLAASWLAAAPWLAGAGVPVVTTLLEDDVAAPHALTTNAMAMVNVMARLSSVVLKGRLLP